MEESVSYLEATNVVFMGCNIVEGEGIGIVIAAGNQNQLSKIIEHTTQSEGKTSLQAEIDRLVAIIAIFALTTTIIVVLYWVFYLRIAHSSFMNLSSMISNVIGITVSYVPEGLPVAMTLGLTIIARRLCSKYFVLVKRLGSIETLGSISFLASDKTGTLTQNKMAVTGIISSTRIEEVAEKDSDIDFMTSNFIKESSERICALCNQSVLESQTPDKQAIASVEDGSGTFCLAVGSNATDRALLNWANSNNTAQNILNDYKQLVLLPFSSATKLTAVVAQKKKTGERFVFIKGAPEYIFPLCSTYIDSRDQVVPKNGEFVSKILNLVEDDGLKGKRIISLAQLGPLSFDQYPNDYEFTTDPKPNFPMDNFTFVSCVCVSDPPREGVKEAVKELRTAGIKVAMVTGDAPNTAVAIARAVGIVSHNEAIDKMTNLGNFKPNVGINILTETEEFSDNKGLESIVVTGRELENIEQEGWDFIFSHNELVFSRTTPDQKLQIVKESQRRGHLVGVTGDGVNDSPALKKANIGIAMNSGSDVAKDVAAIVLLRDDFTAIPKGVREGRLIFENLRKVVGYQISAGSWGEVLPVLATFFLGLPQPLSSFLMIMVCCFSDVYAGIAIMMEPPENAIMLKPPRDLKKSRLLDLKLVFYSYLFYANLISIGSFYNYFIYMASRGNTRAVPDPVPSDDNGNLQFPAGYRSGQLLFAWNWGSDSGNLGADETAAAKVGSSVFYITIVCGQMGHLLSIRRKTPYFYDAIMATQPGSENKNIFVRIWEEISTSEIRFPVLAAWTGAVCTTFILNDIKFFQDDCGTGVVPGRFWGMAIGWSILWFIIAEIRKWLIFLFPESIIAKTAW
jgi:sodium/potassium-transporting ATPase subunit alpha